MQIEEVHYTHHFYGEGETVTKDKIGHILPLEDEARRSLELYGEIDENGDSYVRVNYICSVGELWFSLNRWECEEMQKFSDNEIDTIISVLGNWWEPFGEYVDTYPHDQDSYRKVVAHIRSGRLKRFIDPNEAVLYLLELNGLKAERSHLRFIDISDLVDTSREAGIEVYSKDSSLSDYRYIDATGPFIIMPPIKGEN
jgi:hypothetical protein